MYPPSSSRPTRRLLPLPQPAQDRAASSRGRRRLAAALAALLVAPALAAATATATVGGHGPDSGPEVPTLSWSDCGDGLQCATASVPLDYDHPRGTHIQVALAKRLATDATHRVGSLFVNNGGPGNSVIEFMRTDVTSVLSPEVQARFDIIGMDPRGVGESTPVRCFASVDEQRAFFGARLSFPITPTEVDAFSGGSMEIGRRCAARNGDLLAHLSTANVARDMDLIREAVGDGKLTFAGYSYGGLLGVTYANMFPQRVRALMLDGLPDPVQYTSSTAYARREPVTTRIHSPAATERAMQLFLDRCEAVGPSGCAFASDDTHAKFDELLRRLDQAPPTIDGPDGPATVTRAFLLDNLRGALQFPPIWPDVAGLMELTWQATEQPSTEAGTTSAPAAFDAAYDNSAEAFLAIACSETVNPSNPGAWVNIARRAASHHPYFGADWAWQSQPCATWPVHDADRYDGTFTHHTANPVLFVNATLDAASDYRQAATTAARLPGARLLTLAGSAHPATFVPNACLIAATTAYLVDLQLPEAGAVCHSDVQPFE